MAKPTDRDSFKEYCLRKLGKGVITINVSDEQCDDRIDEAVEMFNLYHYEGFFPSFLKHQLTQEDLDRGYVEVDENVQDVVAMFDVGGVYGNTKDMFNVGYQFALNDVTGLRHAGSMTNYFLSRMHLNNVHKILQGASRMRFNSVDNKIFFDVQKNLLRVDMYLMFEVYIKNLPEISPGVWRNVWLQQYAAAKIKYQWGSNLTKMTGMMLPGNVQFNGERILEDANTEIQKLEDELKNSLAPPAMDFIG